MGEQSADGMRHHRQRCPYCRKPFRSEQTWKRHVQQHDSPQLPSGWFNILLAVAASTISLLAISFVAYLVVMG